MLAGTGLGDDARLAHALCQQCLTEYLIGLVSAAVHQIFAFEIQLGFRAFREVAAQSYGSGSACVCGQQLVEFGLKAWIVSGFHKGFFKLIECGNQKFRDELTAEFAEKRIQEHFVYSPKS